MSDDAQDLGLSISGLPPEEQSQFSAPAPQLEGYRVAEKLGEAGQGQVWRAVQLSTGQEVALKVPRIGLLSSRKTLARFEREVSLVARLKHPHIVRIVDSGVRRGLYYYAMDLIEGTHLDQHVRQNALSQRQILELMRPICDAVRHAHENGVIHRDLKPSNILVTPEGHPYVVDFGLAKSTLEPNATITVSVDGEAAGTPAYMSPEQAAGHTDRIDARTDVYSLGTILFALLTGQHPHDLSGSHFDVLRRISTEEVIRPREVNPKIDRALETLLLKSLEQDPDRRYRSVTAFRRDIDNYLNALPLSVRPYGRLRPLARRVRRHRMAAAGLGVAILLVAGGLHLARNAGPDPAATTREDSAPPTVTPAASALAVAPPPHVVAPTRGLIAHWALDESTGNVVPDSAGGHHGLLYGSPTWAPNRGKMAGALEFDGVDDHVVIQDVGVAGLQQFTIALWVKPRNLAADRIQQFACLSQQLAVVRHDGANLSGGRQLHFFIRKRDGATGDIRINDILEEGVFHHVAATYDGSVMRLYFNGRLLSSSEEAIPLMPGLGDHVTLSDGGAEAFEGLLDDVRVYDRALSNSEIETFMGPPAPKLLVHWRLDESDGKIAYDSDCAEGMGRAWNGWIDDVRIYDFALEPAQVQALAEGRDPRPL